MTSFNSGLQAGLTSLCFVFHEDGAVILIVTFQDSGTSRIFVSVLTSGGVDLRFLEALRLGEKQTLMVYSLRRKLQKERSDETLEAPN